jgi:hypothetical protein
LLHVLVEGLSVEALAAALRVRSVQVHSIRPIKPSLEDVFVSRIRAGQAERVAHLS